MGHHLGRAVTASVPRPVVEPALLNGAGARTRWTNLGFWKDATSYPEAAAELARRVGKAAKLGPGDVVLDLACGHGDSLIMWVREFGVAKVVGIEPDPALVVEVTARIQALGLGDRIVLRAEKAEWLVPHLVCPGVTAVVCVDAAYHFHTRTDWLTTLAKDLPKGTRLGLSDLFGSSRARRSKRIRAMLLGAGIPFDNLWSPQDAEPVMADAGWDCDRLVRCGPQVFGGFVRWARRSALRLLMRPSQGGWRALGTAVAIAVGARRERLEYGIVAARRR